MDTILGFALILMAFAFAVWIVIYVPATMAINRDRSAVLWVIVSLLITPLLSILLLWMLGDS